MKNDTDTIFGKVLVDFPEFRDTNQDKSLLNAFVLSDGTEAEIQLPAEEVLQIPASLP